VIRDEKFIYLFGVHSVMEKLKGAPHEVVEILIAKGRRQGRLRTIEEEARRCGVSLGSLEGVELTRIVGGEKHQGVVAKVFSYTYSDFSGLLKDLPQVDRHHWILVLDGVTDPRNFGSLLRTAEGMGIRDVVIPKDRSWCRIL